MRTRFQTGLVLLAVLVAPLLYGTAAQAQVATPASTDSDQPIPRFALVPVGDYPDGYFDDIKVEPGSSVTLKVNVVNIGNVPVSLKSYKVNAESGTNGGFVAGEEGGQFTGPTNWLNYPDITIELEPKMQQEVTFTINVPSDTSPGQYISGLVVRTAEPLAISGTDSINQIIAYTITVGIVVPGELTRAFELGTPAFVDNDGARFLRVPVTNTGNYLVRPKGVLKVSDVDGRDLIEVPISMGSVYGGLSTFIQFLLPNQFPAGEYTIALSLVDEASGARGEISGAQATLEEPEEPSIFNIDAATVTPNADPIVFANVAVTLNNGGQQLPAADVTLTVLRDGEEVEQFPLATNQVLLNGATEITARYLPAEAWEPGTYAFTITVTAVDPQGGTETILTTYDVEDTIAVP